MSGWVRGLGEGHATEAAKLLAQYEASLRVEVKRPVCLFLFENGAGIFLTSLLGADVIGVARQIAATVRSLSRAEDFYTTCSFVIGLSEINIPQDIRTARSCIDNHREARGVFFLDGNMLPIKE